MKQYINKADVVTELEKLYNLEYDNVSNLSCGKKIMLRNILLFLDTLDTKEVDEENISKDLEEAVRKNVVLETKVMKDSDGDGIDTPYEEWLTLEDTEIPFIPDNIGLKDGDKVKVIIIKQ